MCKLVYGKNEQVRFNSEEEKEEAFNYMLNSPNVNFDIHEENQNQGAWGSEDRIHFRDMEDIPICLRRQLTAGTGNICGRINCKELCQELRSRR